MELLSKLRGRPAQSVGPASQTKACSGSGGALGGESTDRSAETSVALGVSRASVGLDVALLDAGARAEVSPGLAHGGASKEESVRAYYNYILETLRKRQKRERSVGVPEGAFMTSSSIVRQEPPALVMRARAPSVKRRAATSSLGRSKILMSSVTVPTTTAVLDLQTRQSVSEHSLLLTSCHRGV